MEVFRANRDVGHIQHRERCIEPLAQSVVAAVKCHLNQQKENQFIVEIVTGKGDHVFRQLVKLNVEV